MRKSSIVLYLLLFCHCITGTVHPQASNRPSEACGIRDGLVGIVQSVPQITKLATTPFSTSGRTAFSQQVGHFKELEINDDKGASVCIASDYSCKATEMVKAGVKSSFGNDCITAHTIGSIAGPIVVAFFGDPSAITGELSTVSASIKATLQFFKWCDKASDIFTYLSKINKYGSASFKLIKNTSGDLSAQLNIGNITLVRQTGGNFQVKQVQNDGSIAEVSMTAADLNDASKVNKEGFEKVLSKVGNGAGLVYKNIDIASFKKTFTATEEQYSTAYQLWGEEKWDDLYQYFKTNNLNGGWPPFNGAKSILKTEKGDQLAGKVFDRFQGSGDISGEFASPIYGMEGLNA